MLEEHQCSFFAHNLLRKGLNMQGRGSQGRCPNSTLFSFMAICLSCSPLPACPSPCTYYPFQLSLAFPLPGTLAVSFQPLFPGCSMFLSHIGLHVLLYSVFLTWGVSVACTSWLQFPQKGQLVWFWCPGSVLRSSRLYCDIREQCSMFLITREVRSCH